MSRAEIKRLRDDISTLDSAVHYEILKEVDHDVVTFNVNGAFFDMRALDRDSLGRIRRLVDHAVVTKQDLELHEHVMHDHAMRLSIRDVACSAGGEAPPPAAPAPAPAPAVQDKRSPGAKAHRGVFLK